MEIENSIKNLVVVSDTHCGCRLGLFPSEPILLDEGITFLPSKYQKIVSFWWDEFWGEWVPDVTKGEPFAVLVNGDGLDGRHHNSVTQISQNLSDQAKIAATIFEPIVQLCEGRLYWIRGTEAHVGPSAEMEELLAAQLGAVPNEIGQHSRQEIYFNLGGDHLVHAAHHIGVTGSMHYESTALMRELTDAYVEAGRWGVAPPSVVVRSHRHRHAEVSVLTSRGYASVFTTAGWQLKTPFVYRIAGARQAAPQIGGSLIRVGDTEVYTRHKVWSLERPKEDTL